MRKKTQGILSYFILFALVISTEVLSAKHIIGGEITYEFISAVSPDSNRYRFTMKIYRDCIGGGANFDNQARIAIYRGTYANNTRITQFPVLISETEFLVPVPPPCVSSLPNVCVEEGIYTFERTLKVMQNDSYFIVYQRCCRNETINNIVSPGDIGATFMIELTPAAQQLKNSSPTFNTFPPIIICKDIPLNFNHSATDKDGDQIFYRFCSPLAGGGPNNNNGCDGVIPNPPCGPPFSNIPFILPAYSPGNPMGGTPQVSINDLSGYITGTPDKLGQFVVGVCIEEYRGATLLSTVRRDFQFNVAECTQTVVANVLSDTIIGPQSFALRSCGENTITFKNLSTKNSNIFNFEWRFNLNGAPYLNDKDWDATVVFPDTGLYTGALYLNPGKPCADTAYVSINIFPKINADFSFDYDTCIAGPVNFTDLSTGDGIINRWNWNFGVPNGLSDQQNPVFKYADPGSHPVQLRVFDRNNCSDLFSNVVNWFPVPPLIIIQPSKFLGCPPANIFFNNLSSPIDSTYKIVWDFGDGTSGNGVISPTHKYENAGVYNVSVAITSPIGCVAYDTFPKLIRVEPSPVADFSYSPDSLLNTFNNRVQFTDLSSGVNRWNWIFDKYGNTTAQNPAFTFPDTGIMKVTLIATHPLGCKDSLSKYLDFTPVTNWYMPNAFTPNGDGQNDGFLGKGYLEGITNFNMSIWNRWGELVFETSDPNEEWTGRKMNAGNMSPDGVYVYLVTFTGPRGQPHQFKGYATLVR